MSEEKKTKHRITQPVKALAEKIDADIAIVDGAFVIPDDLYNRHLYDGLTPDIIKLSDDYRRDFVAASIYSVGNMAINHMVNDPTVESMTANLTINSATPMSIATHRSVTHPNNLSPGQEPVTKYGVTYVDIDDRLDSRVGQTGSVINELMSIGVELLSGK